MIPPKSKYHLDFGANLDLSIGIFTNICSRFLML